MTNALLLKTKTTKEMMSMNEYELPNDLRQRSEELKCDRCNLENKIYEYNANWAHFYNDVLKFLGLNKKIIDKNGSIGEIVTRFNKPYNVVFLYQSNDGTMHAYGWTVDKDIHKEVEKLLENFKPHNE